MVGIILYDSWRGKAARGGVAQQAPLEEALDAWCKEDQAQGDGGDKEAAHEPGADYCGIGTYEEHVEGDAGDDEPVGPSRAE